MPILVRNRLCAFTKMFLQHTYESVDFVCFTKHLEIIDMGGDQHYKFLVDVTHLQFGVVQGGIQTTLFSLRDAL